MFIPGICIWPFTMLFDLCCALIHAARSALCARRADGTSGRLLSPALALEPARLERHMR